MCGSIRCKMPSADAADPASSSFVSNGGPLDWRQALYYLPAHHVVRATAPEGR